MSRNDIMKFLVLGCRSDITIELQAPVVHEILVLKAYAYKLAYMLTSGYRGLDFRLKLPLLPYFIYLSHRGSDKTAQNS